MKDVDGRVVYCIICYVGEEFPLVRAFPCFFGVAVDILACLEYSGIILPTGKPVRWHVTDIGDSIKLWIGSPGYITIGEVNK